MRLYHVELLGDSSSAQLLHAVADVTEAGVVVLRVLLGKVINVAQRTILERERERGRRALPREQRHPARGKLIISSDGTPPLHKVIGKVRGSGKGFDTDF